MNKQFAPYDIARDLRDLGFNEPCISYWIDNDNREDPSLFLQYCLDDPFYNKSSFFITAPLWQQVVNWLREYKGIIVLVYPVGVYWKYELQNSNENNVFYVFEEGQASVCPSRTCEAGIRKAIQILKERKS